MLKFLCILIFSYLFLKLERIQYYGKSVELLNNAAISSSSAAEIEELSAISSGIYLGNRDLLQEKYQIEAEEEQEQEKEESCTHKFKDSNIIKKEIRSRLSSSSAVFETNSKQLNRLSFIKKTPNDTDIHLLNNHNNNILKQHQLKLNCNDINNSSPSLINCHKMKDKCQSVSINIHTYI